MSLTVTKDDVKKQLTGDTPNFSSDWNTVLDSIVAATVAEFEREIALARGVRSWSFVADNVASARRFTGVDRRLLLIDDCVEVTAVDHDGTALTEDVDFVVQPLNGTPIWGLLLLAGVWTSEPGKVSVTARWGYAATDPIDAKQAVIVESIRAFEAARAGNDDRLGLTPFGQVVTAKAFTHKSWQLIHSYGQPAGILRS